MQPQAAAQPAQVPENSVCSTLLNSKQKFVLFLCSISLLLVMNRYRYS